MQKYAWALDPANNFYIMGLRAISAIGFTCNATGGNGVYTAGTQGDLNIVMIPSPRLYCPQGELNIICKCQVLNGPRLLTGQYKADAIETSCAQCVRQTRRVAFLQPTERCDACAGWWHLPAVWQLDRLLHLPRCELC